MSTGQIHNILQEHAGDFHPVVIFDPAKHCIASIDLSKSNSTFDETVFTDTAVFSAYIHQQLISQKAKYLIGGYNENRGMYSRSELFDKDLLPTGNEIPEPRCIHLGTDIWSPAGTPVFAPLSGIVHSFAFNDNHGDYGATIILEHQLDGMKFHSLYGHMSMSDLDSLEKGMPISQGQRFAHFGKPAENGNWPPHLHFQLIIDMENYEGDYPGVCTERRAQAFLQNCPDPDLVLRLNRYI